MLWTIFAILLVLWAVAMVGFHVTGAYIHLLLVLALIVLILQLFRRRKEQFRTAHHHPHNAR